MLLKHLKYIYFINSIIAFFLVGISIYLQKITGLVPCPLCILQRFNFSILGILFVCGFIFFRNKSATKTITIISILIAFLGIFLSGRQIWLQYFPSMQSQGCSASLTYMMQILPFKELVQSIFLGTAECAERNWTFLSLGLAEWSIIWFIIFFMSSIELYICQLKARNK